MTKATCKADTQLSSSSKAYLMHNYPLFCTTHGHRPTRLIRHPPRTLVFLQQRATRTALRHAPSRSKSLLWPLPPCHPLNQPSRVLQESCRLWCTRVVPLCPVMKSQAQPPSLKVLPCQRIRRVLHYLSARRSTSGVTAVSFWCCSPRSFRVT